MRNVTSFLALVWVASLLSGYAGRRTASDSMPAANSVDTAAPGAAPPTASQLAQGMVQVFGDTPSLYGSSSAAYLRPWGAAVPLQSTEVGADDLSTFGTSGLGVSDGIGAEDPVPATNDPTLGLPQWDSQRFLAPHLSP